MNDKLTAAMLVLIAVGPAAAETTTPAYPGPNAPEEPVREVFSLAAATTFLDAASADWGQNRKCFTCHTNYSYLMVRPAVKVQSPVHAEVRRQLEELVEQRWQKELEYDGSRPGANSPAAPSPATDGERVYALFHHIGLYAFRREALARFVELPPSPLGKREKLEQLRALEAGMRIDAALVDSVPLGVDTPGDLARARALLPDH